MPISTTNCLEISFEGINFESPIDEAIKIKELATNFLENNPNNIVHFNFGGFARLSEKFAHELFKDKSLIPYLDKIKTYGIHVFDQQTLAGAIGKVTA